ncbi:hydroxymethylglutaryl-CoA synthase [Pediococcus claussenii]|uniref:Hydroxymethylglutaryl-CoA synthase n=1 Tax=Pediococcus claussenii (strain ATCC BAA-344 / DSM 14800 / JCM 18046 / KCTC 3811 / LMG 21948 / P06) TaxID=701521 RepID=G8PDD6_PEDCP|nr:hydroxymethylglutaryl-CoA synthase [Pediococcus claussenii]AEV95271.1 hydroxymethylglutaryl-CoA synthase [Pediococcus claussenii ATCC BAA-344]ANZ68807.1 hydroxymethylglutaryl-CoA synthase [Pediococcus claussenii]ANZ70623.1 hydroxymethylglutaryl-CoA synthase [Pediococcus claussenii]KRN19547.1 hypothetical protein IV79_GL001264 [Pediococcus claussenii]
MNIGIDKIGFFTSDLFLDMAELATARNEDPNKYLIGIGQKKAAVIRNSQDSVTLAANAASKIIDDADRQKIDLILFGTESGVDNSKSGSVYLQHLLGINQSASGVELKQACFGLTAGIRLAMGHIMMKPDSRVLLVGSDIARYGLHSSGEVTQGGGAVAMIMSANPRIMTISKEYSHYTKDIMDFWRPLGFSEALVDGKYSSDEFIQFFLKTYNAYKDMTKLESSDFEALVFHLPFTKMGYKALRAGIEDETVEEQNRLFEAFDESKQLSQIVGNLYTGSLYLSLISLLINRELKQNDIIGLFSYGSGAEGEFFSGKINNYDKQSLIESLKWLDQRKQVTVKEYERIYLSAMLDSDDFETDYREDPAKFILKGQKNHQRIYGEH